MSRSNLDAYIACFYIVGIILCSYSVACCSEYMYKFIRWYAVEPVTPRLALTKVQPVSIKNYVIVLNPNNIQSLGHISSE